MPELIWEGKYDDAGRRVSPPRLSLPFQTVETVNESAQARQRSLSFGDSQSTDWRNRLIWGDNKYVLRSLLEEFAGAVDLVYIDPPFATGQDFSFTTEIPDTDHDFLKQPSVIEQKAYRDTWGKGIDSYLAMMADRLASIYGLLNERGTLYLHLGKSVASAVRLVCDEVFGIANFVDEITWKRSHAHGDTGQGATHFGRVTESILVYGKSQGHYWVPQYADYTEDVLDRDYKYIDKATGERYRLMPVDGPGGAAKGNPYYEFLGVRGYWRYSEETMQELYDAGEIVLSSTGRSLSRKRYLKDAKGTPVTDLWDDVNRISPTSSERVNYATQKPIALLNRIISTSSREGGLVADFFCGSGTTLVAAEQLGRRWIGCDLGRFAVHVSRKRLLDLSDVSPFIVQNLGKYERQLWQEAEFGDSASARTDAYRAFILDLYHSAPVTGYSWLHGLRQGRMVHVGTVDAPVTNGDVKQIVAEFRKAVGTGKDAPSTKGVDILGWDFAFELNEVARQDAEKAGIDLRLVRIPREVLDKRAVEQGDIRFFELAALSVDVKQSRGHVTLKVDDFIIPLDDVPADVQKAVTHWSQWIDYWAVDWDNKDDTFHNEWQSYRTRQSRELRLTTEHVYSEPGEYRVVVKVIDILGNDTTKTISLQVVRGGA
jgi:DNA modification methylase